MTTHPGRDAPPRLGHHDDGRAMIVHEMVQLDADIHRRLFGVEIQCSQGANCNDIPDYTNDYQAAMLVYFAMVEMTGHGEIICDMEDYGREPGDIVTVVFGLDETVSYTGHAPVAICRAALMWMDPQPAADPGED